MPNIAQFHPQIVHFVVVLLLVGLGFRIVSLTPWFRFTNYGATTLLLMGAVAAMLAVKSGTDAHGPVERIPGTRDLVVHHEELGEKARNIFLVVALIEIVAWGLGRTQTRARFARYGHVASALVGIYGSVVLYEAAEHGGELVYSYAGGPGLRTGDPKDVERLLLAGLYNQAQVDRREGRSADAASLIAEMGKRFPNDVDVKFLQAESQLRDSKNYPAALAAVNAIPVPENNSRLQSRKGTLQADIYLAMGKPDSARAILAPLVAANPRNTRLKAKLDSIK